MQRRSIYIAVTVLLFASSGPACADRKEDILNPIPYVVTQPNGYIDSPIDPATVYEYKRRGYVDAEPMDEIRPYLIPERQLPPPVVIPHSGPGEVERVVAAQRKPPPLKGEDRIFEQIAKDQLIMDCILEDTLENCEGVEIVLPEQQPRSRRIVDRQIRRVSEN